MKFAVSVTHWVGAGGIGVSAAYSEETQIYRETKTQSRARRTS
jgi:hypothetical protein